MGLLGKILRKAPGPAPEFSDVAALKQEVARLRGAYLELMKDCIIGNIYRDPGNTPARGESPNPPEYRMETREFGQDWPLVAHSMIGNRRMINLWTLCEDVIARGVPGDFIETGAWRGGACIFMRALLKTPLIGDATLTVGRLLFGKHMVKKELEKAFYPQAVPEAYLQHASASWLRHKEVRAILEDEYTLDKELDEVSEHYYEIRIPVVVVTGDQDKVVSAKDNAYRLKDSIIQSQLVLLKNTGHQVPQTHPESIYNALTLIPGSSLDQRPAADSSATHVSHFQ